jgi:hypothetical protein
MQRARREYAVVPFLNCIEQTPDTGMTTYYGTTLPGHTHSSTPKTMVVPDATTMGSLAGGDRESPDRVCVSVTG